MWSVERAVEEFRGKNVDLSYPQNEALSCEFVQSPFPQLFFSVYRDLRHLLGFPRPYYYY